MKAKLIKVDGKDYYNLENEKGTLIGTTFEFKSHVGDNVYALCHKNCQAIKNGYDLDELANLYSTMTVFIKKDEIPTEKQIEDAEHISEIAFKEGFQKALELLGDKKFSEEDVISMIEKSRETGLTAEYLILTKQQAEWEVEIEMEYHPTNHASGLELTGNNLMDVSILENYKPKLDADGCLILKLKAE